MLFKKYFAKGPASQSSKYALKVSTSGIILGGVDKTSESGLTEVVRTQIKGRSKLKIKKLLIPYAINFFIRSWVLSNTIALTIFEEHPDKNGTHK
tara:strand:+ start:218 stop:502 length:285 start_codon:yes stop_codon:yes gene_type:complete